MTLSDGRPVWHRVASLVADWGADLVGERGLSAVGAVVGATHPRAVGEARKLMPQSILLLPGVGAQGAKPADLERAFTSGPASALVAASRSVIYAFREGGGDFRAAAGAEAARLRERDMDRLRAGSQLSAARSWRVYAAPGGVPARRDDRVALLRSELQGSSHAAPTLTPAGSRTSSRSTVMPQRKLYVVRAGDTIAAISVKTHVAQARILALNPKVCADGALHRREAAAPMRGLLAAFVVAVACCAARVGKAPRPRSVDARAWLVDEPGHRRGARRARRPLRSSRSPRSRS